MLTRQSWKARVPWPISPELAARALGVVSAIGLVASYLLSWELWQPRFYPPNLPAVDSLSSFGFGVPLLVAAVVAIGLPRVGAVLHSGLLVLAMLGDQIRIQPVFFSLGILLLAAAWPRHGLAIARWHLVALWAWAGLHKALSGGWPSGAALFIADSMGSEGLRVPVAVLVPVIEVGLAALALRRRFWPVLRVVAPLFHIGIVILLAKVHWNTGVWPWNLTLAAAAPLVFLKAEAVETAPTKRRALVPTAAALVLALSPVGFYVGLTDAYLAHNLYTSNVAGGSVCTPAAFSAICDSAPFLTWDTLNLPLPPEKRLFVAWFNEICQPGQRLRIDGIWTRLADRQVDFVDCPPQRALDAQP